jgi:tetratricopeptide (TPR) repeat protein
MNNLAVLYRYQGKYEQAEQLNIKVVETRRRVLGVQHPGTLTSMSNLARLYQEREKYGRAETLYASVLEIRRRVLGPRHPNTASVLASLAELWLRQQRYGDAEPLLREALASYEKAAQAGWRLNRAQSLLGASLAGQQKYPEAEVLLLSGYQGMLQREPTIPVGDRIELEQTRKWIVQLYQDWKKPEQATEWLEKLRTPVLFTSPIHP